MNLPRCHSRGTDYSTMEKHVGGVIPAEQTTRGCPALLVVQAVREYVGVSQGVILAKAGVQQFQYVRKNRFSYLANGI